MDTSKLRESDIEPLRKIVGALEKIGLTVELAGSATKGDKLYRDVDLLAKGNISQISEARTTLVDPKFYTEQAVTIGRTYFKPSHNPMSYCNVIINDRFEVKLGETIVDISLKFQ